MDAITLSTAQLVKADRLNAVLAWRVILVAAIANTLFKGLLVLMLGHPRLGWRIAALFAAVSAGGAALLLLWPDDRVGTWLRGILPATQPGTT
jgi:uncharacterized membrane protein (DUF4010 family)